MKFLVVYLEKYYGLSNEKRIEDVIKVVANENRYHPVLDRINSITWDGRERIRYALHHFLGAEVSEYTYEVMKLFMIGTIARISCPGIKFEVMLCLVGGQGAGKSTFLRFLAMEDDWFTDDLKKMQEDTKKELILDYLEHYEGSMVCSRQLYSEALGNDGNPAQWEIREINDIMNNCSDWIAFSNPRHFPEPYRRQKGWEKPDNRGQDFQPITKEQMEQLSLPPEWMER